MPTASRLDSIIAHGLQAGRNEASARGLIEPSLLAPDGVYCGLFTAYFGAYAAFCAYARNVLAWPGHKPSCEFYFDYPVVVGIRLGEDVEVRADEDFLPGILPDQDESELYTISNMRRHARVCWNRYRSCVAPQVPSQWIIEIEVFDALVLLSPDPLSRERFQCDLHTLACGVVQTQQRLTFQESMQRWKQAVRVDLELPTLSRKIAADEKGLQLLRAHPFRQPENSNDARNAVRAIFNQLSLLSPKYGIQATRG